MPNLRFRLPGRPQSLGGWLASLLPSFDRRRRRRLIEEGRVSVDGRVADRSSLDCPPGALVEVDIAVDEAADLTREDSAMEALRQALDLGLGRTDLLATDPDLDTLRSREDFKELLDSEADTR